MNRTAEYASRRPVQTRLLVIGNADTQTGGRRLSGENISMHMQSSALEEARHKLQMKYKKEAEEAAEKKKQKEQKKREAWLARQEALVRCGHVLGRGKKAAEPNLLRDYVECQDEYGSQQDKNVAEQSWMNHQYNVLVQQRIERGREVAQMQRREQSKEVKLRGQGAVARPGTVSGLGLPVQTSDYFLGTGYTAAPSSSNSNGHNGAHVVSPAHMLGSNNTSTSFPSNSHGFASQATDGSSGHVFGGATAVSAGHMLGVNNVASSPKPGSYDVIY